MSSAQRLPPWAAPNHIMCWGLPLVPWHTGLNPARVGVACGTRPEAGVGGAKAGSGGVGSSSGPERMEGSLDPGGDMDGRLGGSWLS